jgi:asparagine synthase (glutamine-hydrolysing)
MTGLVGGHRTGSELTALLDGMHYEPWYETTRLESGQNGFALLEHGDKDPESNRLWENGRYQTAVHGVISNFSDLSWTMEDIASGIFDHSTEVLSKLEGPFLLACYDQRTGRYCVATDKLGSRPCYYTNQHEFQFGSQISALLPAVTDPTIDRNGISDILLFTSPIGDNTLVEEVRALPPATVLRYGDNEGLTTTRYWKPSLTKYAPGGTADGTTTDDQYVADWISEYQRSIGNLADTIRGDLGVWLSGGIDSRTAAIALQNEDQPFTTFTYETRFESDQPVARKVANALGVRNYQVNSGPPEKLCAGIKKAIEINDGMQAWSSIVSLPFMTHELSDFADIVMEGSRFLGEDVWAHALRTGELPTEILIHKKGHLSETEVEELVGVSNPAKSLRRDIKQAGCDSLPYRLRVLDTMRRYYGYTHMRSNVIQRSQAGTRVVSDGDVVNTVLNMPNSLRMQTIPGTGGKLPYGVPKIKLDVMRALDNPATEVPYQRSMRSPNESMAAHVAGFYGREVKEKLVSQPYHPYLDAYRTQSDVQNFLNGLLDDAKRRDVFDADRVTDLQRRVLDGESDDITPIAAITGVEYWLRTHLDTTEKSRVATTV